MVIREGNGGEGQNGALGLTYTHYYIQNIVAWPKSSFRLVIVYKNPNKHFGQPSKVNVVQSCPALCDPLDYSLPGSSVHGILQDRILECVAVPFSRGSSQPRDRIQVSCVAGGFFTI